MATKWTEGPWVAMPHTTKASNFAEHVAHVRAGNKIIARVNGGETEDREIALANARLIAAAPDLYEALKAMTDRWEPDCVGTDRAMWENARAALSRATGER